MSNELHENYYNNPAFWGDSLKTIPKPKGELDRINKTLESIPKDVTTILDVGCGDGRITNEMAKEYQVTGLDISTTALKYVKTKVINGSIDNNNLEKGSFDLVTCFETLEHLPVETFKIALQELTRISAKYIMISVPFREQIYADFTKCPVCHCSFNAFRHLRSFDLDMAESLLPDCKLMKYDLVGPKIKEWSKINLYFKNDVFGVWKNTNKAVCPQCGNNKFPYPRNIFFYITGGIYVASTILPWKKHRKWIILTYQKNSS